jgi:hypothetical protein
MARPWLWPTVPVLLSISLDASARGFSGYLVNGPMPRVVCKPKQGFLEPYVPDAATAKAIFLAVEKARVPRADRTSFPMVDVFDKPDRWVVFRHGAALGGGQLELEIAKCSGRI